MAKADGRDAGSFICQHIMMFKLAGKEAIGRRMAATIERQAPGAAGNNGRRFNMS